MRINDVLDAVTLPPPLLAMTLTVPLGVNDAILAMVSV